MIEVKNLRKTYHNSTGDFVAIKDLSFNLGNNGLVFLYGESGEGKSTLLNVLAGLDTYDKGTIKYNGKDIQSMKQKERDSYRSSEIGLIFETDNLVPSLTVAENIALGRKLYGEECKPGELDNILKSLKIADTKHRKLGELSSGQIQRVAIARVLLQNPNILFVDEPTRRLDAKNSKEFWKVLKKQSKDKLIVAISHDLSVVEEFADRVLEISAGQIIQDTYLNKEYEKADAKLFEENTQEKFVAKKRDHIKFGTAINLGMKSVSSNLFRYISTIVLCCFVLVAFSVSYLLGTYNAAATVAKSAEVQHLKYVNFTKTNNKEITNEDIAAAYSSGITSPYYKVYTANQKISYGNGVVASKNLNFCGGYIELANTSTTKNALGQKVLYGTYPTTTDAYYKVAISDYLASLMSKYGTSVKYDINDTELHTFKDSSIDTLVGKCVKVGDNWLLVGAIYETNYVDYVDKDTLFGETDTFDYNFKNIYSVIHISTGSMVRFVRNSGDAVLAVEDTNSVQYAVGTLDGEYNTIGGQPTLNGVDIVIPYTLFNQIYGVELTQTEALESPDGEALSQAIVNSGKSAKIAVTTTYGYTTEYNVVGVSTGNNIYLADAAITELLTHVNYPVLSVASKYAGTAELTTLIENFAKQNMTFTTQYSKAIDDVSGKIAQFKDAFIAVAVVSTIFVAYYIGYFYVDTISREKRTVGVLRTMGATSIEVSGIYLSASFITTIITTVAGLLFAALGVGIINLLIVKSFNLPLYIFSVTGGLIGWTLLLGVGTSIVGSMFPIIIYCLKTPVEVAKR